MEMLAGLFGGLGLFFLGVKGLSGQLAAMAGPRMRAAMAKGTSGPYQAAALGLLLGAVTQSSNAVTFIAASMRAAGMIAPRRVIPLLGWANVGTAGLVLVATLDLRIAALWLLGAVGFASYFATDGGGRWRPVLAALAGLGFMLLGLGLIKGGAAPLRDMEMVRAILAFGGEAWLPPFLVGLLITLVAQSSSTVSILAITLKAAGLLTYDQAVATIYGASMGSGLAVWLLAGGLTGTARQPVIWQAMLRAAGSLLFLAMLELERGFGVPLVLWLVERLAHQLDTQLALVFLLLQLVTALLATPLHRPLERLLERMAPATEDEGHAQPRYLYPQALEDAPSALELVVAEQRRLAERLPHLLAPVREEPDGGAPVASAASAALEQEIARFIAALLSREMPSEALRDAVRLQARLGLLTALRETIVEYVGTAQGLLDVGMVRPVASMAEAMHVLLEELREMEDPGAAAWLAELASDRGEMMQRLRRQAAGVTQERFFALTGQFERGVWLVRRLALLEAEQV
jgi:phosphate:Na+ symporter